MSQRQSPLEYHVFDPEKQEIRVVVVEPPRTRYWVHALLFLATVFTTLCIGARLQYNFTNGIAPFSQDTDLWPFNWVWQDWHRLLMGIPYGASLLAILTAHELGHYVYCVKRKVFATLPFFIPSPLLLGTFGAFIRIKSPIRTREDLFDIGIAGPIAGFVVAVPVLFLGLMASRELTYNPNDGLTVGHPSIFYVTHYLLSLFGSHSAGAQLPLSQIALHPVAMAAWVGMFATSLNLLPGGQLDGGHIVYAISPRLHFPISMACVICLLPLSWYLWAGWLLWAIVIRITGTRHPIVPPSPPLDMKRRWLAALALLMFVLTLSPAPLPGNSLEKQLQEWRQQRQDQQSQPPSK